MREEVFEENADPKNKQKAHNWMNGVMGKHHIKDLGYEETIHLIAELECKAITGKALKTLIEERKVKNTWKVKRYWKLAIRLPLTKLAIFFGIIKYK